MATAFGALHAGGLPSRRRCLLLVAILAAAALLVVLQDLLRRRVLPLVSLCTMFCRVTAVQDQVVEVSCTTDAIHLLVFVGC